MNSNLLTIKLRLLKIFRTGWMKLKKKSITKKLKDQKFSVFLKWNFSLDIFSWINIKRRWRSQNIFMTKNHVLLQVLSSVVHQKDFDVAISVVTRKLLQTSESLMQCREIFYISFPKIKNLFIFMPLFSSNGFLLCRIIFNVNKVSHNKLVKFIVGIVH